MIRFNLLFGGIIELILVGADEALLDAGVCPEAFHRLEELFREGLGVLHRLDHIAHHSRVFGLQVDKLQCISM